MKRSAYFSILFLTLWLPANLWAQDFRATKALGLRMHYGYIFNHAPVVAHLATQNMPALELEYSEYSRGNKKWHSIFGFPQQGVSLFYFMYDPAKPIGNNLSLVPFYTQKILGKPGNHFLSFKVGLGPGFSSKRFDLRSNPTNNMISTFLNYTLCGQLRMQLWLAPQWRLNGGIGVVHLSNGSWQKPNQGINQVTSFLGMEYCFGKDTALQKVRPSDSFKRHHWALYVAGSAKEHEIDFGRTPVLQSMTYYEYRASRINGISVGIDFMYDPGKEKMLPLNTPDKSASFYNLHQWALLVGHELYFNNVGFMIQVGRYLHDPLMFDRKIYQRYACRYYFSPHFFSGISMKAHSGTADWVEWGIGIKL